MELVNAFVVSLQSVWLDSGFAAFSAGNGIMILVGLLLLYMAFVKEFNERTAKQAGLIIPVEITVFEDRSFTFITKTPPAAVLLKKAANLEKASGEPNKTKVAKLPRAKAQEIAQLKMQDLNAADLEAATRMIEGTARSMGIEIV